MMYMELDMYMYCKRYRTFQTTGNYGRYMQIKPSEDCEEYILYTLLVHECEEEMQAEMPEKND